MVNHEYYKNKTNGNLLIFCQSTSRISTYFRTKWRHTKGNEFIIFAVKSQFPAKSAI